MRYLIVIEKTGKGCGAYAPDLPGVIVAGETREETVGLMRVAVRMHVGGSNAPRAGGSPCWSTKSTPRTSTWTTCLVARTSSKARLTASRADAASGRTSR